MREPLAATPFIAGVDEAGRGPLAGPVVTAAVVLPEGFECDFLDDSKKLTAEQRETAERIIKASAEFAVVTVSHEKIDAINILNATLAGMQLALERLPKPPRAALIDGNRIPPLAPVPCSPIIKGDATYASIAAASILAKVERDRIMVEYGAEYPQYGFERHFGYSTPEHFAAIREHGPCPIHRRSFEPVRTMVLQPCLSLGI
ncbi:MAG: ribonuclease HII [Chthonomonas sp.]|nr:ribonuclease HII [Chthonomonas sp.]